MISYVNVLKFQFKKTKISLPSILYDLIMDPLSIFVIFPRTLLVFIESNLKTQ